MTTAILTDERLVEMAANELQEHFDRLPNSIFLFARAIEQSVLQSPEIQSLRKDASLAAEHRKLLEGAAAVLENCADDMEDEGDEIGAHEARSMANVINDVLEKQP